MPVSLCHLLRRALLGLRSSSTTCGGCLDTPTNLFLSLRIRNTSGPMSPEDLRPIMSVLRSGDKERAAALAETQGLVEEVVNMIKDSSSSRTTKASIVTAYYLALASERAASRLADSDSVGLLLELLVDSSDRSVSEKALGALDAILGSERGRDAAYRHALTMPVPAKRMFAVSDVATEFAVSGIWKLRCGSCSDERRGRLAKAAASTGAFQKVLLLLQVGCSRGTKVKATELLRMLNRSRGDDDCVDSADFRGGIRRNF